MSLVKYRQKRDFKETPEPRGIPLSKGKQARFVIQKHAASHLHYDFRLEMDGLLKSWALPKGVPYAHGEKRLAVHVEDHPVSYRDFEGVIPKGQYGGGTVMVWDRGTYQPLSKAPSKELASGKLHFTLTGKKLRGEWYLVRLRDDRQWLIIRGGESLKPVSKRMDDVSALSGKSMKELAGGKKMWQPNREPQEKTPAAVRPPVNSRNAMPKFIEPMKALLVESPPAGEWVYEVKFDGFRALAFKNGIRTRLLSRNEIDLGGKFPEVAEAVSELATDDAIVDGEIVALNKKGVSSFQGLQAVELGEQRLPIFYYAFDLLRLEGEDLRALPLGERKARLKRLLGKRKSLIRYSESLEGEAGKLLKQARKVGLEGLIGKRRDSVYETGRRSGAWIKLKILREQEFVIGGYSDPEGSRTHFGALLIGVYEGGGKNKSLKFTGKVGTGFNDKLLTMLHGRFKRLSQKECPFANLPEKRHGRGLSITASVMKRCHWVKPVLVCQIKFSEWTAEGKLRQPVFLGLREDKDAREVTREEAE